MSPDLASKTMANKLLAETSDLLSTLQSVQRQLRTWSVQAAGEKSYSRRPPHGSIQHSSRKDNLAKLRQTVEDSRKRINCVLSKMLKDIKAAEKSGRQLQGTAPIQTGVVKDTRSQKATSITPISSPDLSQRLQKRHRSLRSKLRQHDGAYLGEIPNGLHKTDTTRSASFRGSLPHDLRYSCDRDDLGLKMVSTILKARATLIEQAVDNRGYLILVTSLRWNPHELDEMFHLATKLDKEYSKGFVIHDAGDGFQHIYRNDKAKLASQLPSFAIKESLTTPEQDFQLSFDSMGQVPIPVSYVIGPHASDTETGKIIKHLLHPGPVTSQRPDLPGINSPYWYVSCENGTSTTMHIEDGLAGSANMLLAGAEKHWIIIHRTSTETLENFIRDEFASSKSCSQFVRHHHISLSPRWLRERGIEFDLARQCPGEILVILPGSTYHEIRNAGPNFAAAINYEFPDTPDSPTGYVWCQKRRCGPNAIRLKDFRIPLTQQDGTSNQQRSDDITKLPERIATNDIVEIEDDKPYELPALIQLPEQQSSPDSEIDSLIKAVVDQKVAPHWFNCKDIVQVEVKLGQFRWGTQLRDDVLQNLLVLIALRRGYYVAESLTLDLAKVTACDVIAEAGPQAAGIVLPFHVNAAVQSSSRDRDHWVLALVDFRTHTFTTWGIESKLASQWADGLDSAMDLDCSLLRVQEEFPTNPDGASCALCCCFALDGYLNTIPHDTTTHNMRAYYLRKLLDGYNLSTLHYQVSGHTVVAMRVSSDDSVEENIDVSDVVVPTACLAQTHIHKALADTSLPCTKRKVRLIQMILRCSMDDFSDLSTKSQIPDQTLPISDDLSPIFALMQQIEDSTGLYLHALRSRFLLLKLHLVFESKVSDLEKKRAQNRKERRRATASGHRLSALPSTARKIPRNAIMDELVQSFPGNETKSKRSWRAKLSRYLEIGKEYYMLVSNLGLGLLPSIPHEEAAPCDLQGAVPADLVSTDDIDPTEYHRMSEAEARFFTNWFIYLNPDLKDWNSLDLNVLYLDESYWTELTHLNAKVLGNIFGGAKRSFTSVQAQETHPWRKTH